MARAAPVPSQGTAPASSARRIPARRAIQQVRPTSWRTPIRANHSGPDPMRQLSSLWGALCRTLPQRNYALVPQAEIPVPTIVSYTKDACRFCRNPALARRFREEYPPTPLTKDDKPDIGVVEGDH